MGLEQMLAVGGWRRGCLSVRRLDGGSRGRLPTALALASAAVTAAHTKSGLVCGDELLRMNQMQVVGTHIGCVSRVGPEATALDALAEPEGGNYADSMGSGAGARGPRLFTDPYLDSDN